ncbi:MAG: class II fructose-bisphosphate aldolase [candidate division WS1 bacterium]|jgi:fructose-bisphosphate aldolase class II|nr:class II fructose-bisphosphate aldolase [candidate division WS1 bacterium]
MPLVTSYEVLPAALEGGYAIGAFNANNLESVNAIIEACAEKEAPVILQVSQGAIQYAGLWQAAGMVKTAAEAVSIPVVLHLDHGTSWEQNVQCLRAGFTSLMYDGSKEDFEVNVENTASIVRMGHACGVPVEAELGLIPKVEEFLTTDELRPLIEGECDNINELLSAEQIEKLRSTMTDIKQAVEFVERTGVDSLAVAVGNIHGVPGKGSQIDFDHLQALQEATGIPLVLHGSSGTPDDQLKRACTMGLTKINVATHLSMVFIEGIKEALAKDPDQKDFRKVLGPGMTKIKNTVYEYIELFGCAGRASKAVLGGPTEAKITKESPE